jgi:hypothetical protein
MTIPVAIAASIIAAGGAFLIALAGALFNINNKLGRLDAHQEILEKGQQKLTTEIRDARDYIDTQLAAAEKRALTREDAAEKRAIAREAAAEERALARHEAAMAEIRAVERAVEERSIARHNELMAEIRLWRHHGHDADGNIFFRVPE